MTQTIQPNPAQVTLRSVAGLAGIFVGAMLSGLNNRSGSIGIVDVRGLLGFSVDEFSWMNTVYAAGELMVMPFASWLAITFTMRRFHLAMVCTTSLLACLIPLTVNLPLLLILRFLQGISAGSLIPLLMMAALKILPPPIRLHGLALYAMTATLVPNLSFWVVGHWVDTILDIRWIYWQFILGAPVSAALVLWGFPREHVQWSRFSSINLPGLLIGATSLGLVAVALDQGNRLDWFNSPIICFCSVVGLTGVAAYVITEWHHPMPFIKFQLLERRNLHVCFSVFVVLLVIFASGSIIPSAFLTGVWGYRPTQNGPLGLMVGLPQIFMGSVVAMLLYQRWVDARVVFATGLGLIASACFLAAQLDSTWIWKQFALIELLEALGQPMAVVSMLFLATSVVHPSEGPYVSGCVNTFRALGSLIGGAAINRLLEVREKFHSDVLVDRLGSVNLHLPIPLDADMAAAAISPQVVALATADVYRTLGTIGFILVPVVLLLTQYIPAPSLKTAHK